MLETDVVLTDEFYISLSKKIDDIKFLLEATTGALIEITWILKAFCVIFLAFSVWRLIRR